MGSETQEEQINALLGDEGDESIEERESETSDSGEEAGSEVSAETEESSEGEESEEISEPEGEESDDSEEGSENDSEESESDESEAESLSEIEALRAEVDRLAAMVNQKEKSSSESSESSETPSVPEANIDPSSLFGDNFDFESVVESEESFKSFLTDFAKKIQSSTHESILQTLPDTVSSYVSEQVTVKEQVNDFYKNNPDLSNTKKYVSVTANEVASEHPDWDFPTVLDETAKRVRKSLGLKEEAKASEKSDSSQKKSPALAKGTKGQSSKKKPKQELSAMEQEIMELLEE